MINRFLALFSALLITCCRILNVYALVSNNIPVSIKEWSGDSSQDELMKLDQCILVDEHDNIIGCDSKLNCHLFNNKFPSGRLHRAFSVFLFDDNGRLLLQQRAKSKLTFPSVWTNTCCSHPLFSFALGEVDSLNDIRHGHIPGIRRAANRKLQHELGIDCKSILDSEYQFVSRVLYSAKDEGSLYSPEGCSEKCYWGESEVDYILFLRKNNVKLQQNPDEVDATKYVTQLELKAMLADRSNKWSPWFRLTTEKFLFDWWDRLDEVMIKDSPLLDWKIVHKLN